MLECRESVDKGDIFVWNDDGHKTRMKAKGLKEVFRGLKVWMFRLSGRGTIFQSQSNSVGFLIYFAVDILMMIDGNIS